MTATDINARVQLFLESASESIRLMDFQNAIEELKAAEVLDPENPQVLYNLGVLYSKTGLHKTAIDYFTKLLALESSFVEIITVKKLLAYTLIMTQDYARSRSILDEVEAVLPADTTVLNMKGYVCERQQNLTDALSAYRKVISIDSENYNALNSAAYILALKGENLDRSKRLCPQVLRRISRKRRVS